MDAQPDSREISLPNLSTHLVEANSSAQRELVDHLLVVGHVIDKPVKRCLLHSLSLSQLWDGTNSSGGQGLRCLSRLWIPVFVFFAHFLLWP